MSVDKNNRDSPALGLSNMANAPVDIQTSLPFESLPTAFRTTVDRQSIRHVLCEVDVCHQDPKIVGQ